MFHTSTDIKPFVRAFVQLGNVMRALADKTPWPGFEIGLSKAEYERLDKAMGEVALRNPWFTEDNVRHALKAWGEVLTESGLRDWLSGYAPASNPKTIAIIMAGNIPAVGFHDLLCVLLTGHKALVKLSADDDVLIPIFVKLLAVFCPEVADRFTRSEGKLTAFDAVIATGSDNSSRYFEYYFGQYPHIIRKNRTSVAIIGQRTTEEDLALLADDVFTYFGLGCRSVTKLYVPDNFELDRFFGAIYPRAGIATHNRYANNYDYHKALWMLNGEDLIENGFLLMKEDSGLHSPVGTMYYERYSDLNALSQALRAQSATIQCIVGEGGIPFGTSQRPGLNDYADGIDTMHFLSRLT